MKFHILFLSILVNAFEPDFVFPLENVTISQGRDATFTCVVNNLGGYRVSGEGTPARVCISFSMLCSLIICHHHPEITEMMMMMIKAPAPAPNKAPAPKAPITTKAQNN